MATTVSNLPDDKDSLKEIIRSQALSFAETVTLKEQNHAEKKRQYQYQVKTMEEEIAILAKHVRFFNANLYAKKTETLTILSWPGTAS